VAVALLIVGLVSLAPADVPAAAASTEAPSYDTLELEGWSIHRDTRLAEQGEHAALGVEVHALLRAKLIEVRRLLPPTATAHLQQVPLWVELDNSRAGPGCCYHPSRQWLATNGFNPDKAKGVEICSAQNFIGWADDQPAAVLHELAHAWHDQVLGWDEPRVRAQWDAVVATGQYDEVLHINGRRQKHYALNNHKEYFAEMSEAYFWTNDFHPFVRAELREVDPGMFELLKESWAVDPRSAHIGTDR
jgi:hypothetical protein